MKDIIAFLNERGLYPQDIILDGKIQRFQIDKEDHKKSGWYVGWQGHTLKSGEGYEILICGNFREDISYFYQTDKKTFTKEDRVYIRKQKEEGTKLVEEVKNQVQKDQAVEAEKCWEKFLSNGRSEYLSRKQINIRELGIKFDETGNFFVPMRDSNGKLWSFQKIGCDGEKRFFYGGRVKGNFYSIGDTNDSEIIRITEGFATGVSIFMATGEFVVVAFNASNLTIVAKELKLLYPEKVILICGDEDKFKKNAKGETPNIGREKAVEAATLCLGKAVFPKFINESNEPTDFNDLHVREGLNAVKDQVTNIEIKKFALYALGFKEKEYFFTSTENRQLVSVVSFTERDLLDLMPISYWEASFPGRSENVRVNWTDAKSTLMKNCRAVGLFKGHNVRGAGVWIDNKRIVVNMGDHLIVDGMRCELGTIKSRYFYTLGESFKKLHDKPLSTEECKVLTDTCQKFKWTKDDSGILLAGILVLSRVCGALPIRPHCWITGSAQTGKSTLLENLIRKIIGSSGLYVQSGTTEAGVRQHLKSDALPVLFDEFETNGRKSDENITSLIELMRASWSDSSAHIVKGSAGGNASHFQVRFSAIVSSIRTSLVNDADKGRFTILELAPHGSDHQHWKELSELLSQINEEYADRLFSRVIKLIPTMLENFKFIKKEMAGRVSSRFGDQYGMILAGYSILVQDAPITEDDAIFLCDNIELEEEKENSGQTDHDDCLIHLLSTKIQDNGCTKSIVEMIVDAVNEPDNKFKINDLKRQGLGIQGSCLFIANNNHAELKRIFGGTKWINWALSLRRIDGALTSPKTLSFTGKDYRGTLIPLKYALGLLDTPTTDT